MNRYKVVFKAKGTEQLRMIHVTAEDEQSALIKAVLSSNIKDVYVKTIYEGECPKWDKK